MRPAEMNAVEIDNLTYTYPGASQPTLNDISLRITQGDFLAVVGNNGCGNTGNTGNCGCTGSGGCWMEVYCNGQWWTIRCQAGRYGCRTE